MPIPAGGSGGADKLASEADLAAFLQIDGDDLNTTAAVVLLEAATAVVQEAAGRQRIVLVTDDEVTIDVDGYNNRFFVPLPERPVVSVSAVSIGGTTVSDHTLVTSRNSLYRADGWTSGLDYLDVATTAVVVTYTHGYAEDDQRIQLARSACLSLAAGAYTNPAGALREQIDDYSVAYAEALAQMAISPHLARALRSRYGRSLGSVRLIAAS